MGALAKQDLLRFLVLGKIGLTGPLFLADRDAALDMLADALQRLVGRPLRLEGYEFNAPVRVGWALAQGEPANAQDLLDRALDAAGAVPAADTAPQEDENK